LAESVEDGIRLLQQEGCDGILAVGGGSAMDVAKCIKLYAAEKFEGDWLSHQQPPNNLPLLAVPTTAGTGSEATRYAVVYQEGEKQSVTDDSLVPQLVWLEPSVLDSLTRRQRLAPMLDAFCHAVEAAWSVNSTEESWGYAREALALWQSARAGYLANEPQGNADMQQAAYLAGKAINITQTTAGHAMCYKLTSLFGCAHGHAAILCDRVLFPWMIAHTDRCSDRRGEAYLKATLDEIGQALGCANAQSGAEKLNQIFDSLELEVPAATEEQFALLRESVNPDRLKNHPAALDVETIDGLYRRILR
jgi:alcohol dehydrogenase class IV